MATKRLTNALKDDIFDNVKRLFAERFKHLANEENELALDVREDVLGEHAEAFNSIPAEFLRADNDFAVEFGGSRVRVNLADYMPIWYRTYDVAKSYPKSHRFVKRYSDIEKKRAALDAELKTLMGQTKSIVNSVTTIKALLIAWPEGKVLIPEYAFEETKFNLPAVIVENASKLLTAALEKQAA